MCNKTLFQIKERGILSRSAGLPPPRNQVPFPHLINKSPRPASRTSGLASAADRPIHRTGLFLRPSPRRSTFSCASFGAKLAPESFFFFLRRKRSRAHGWKGSSAVLLLCPSSLALGALGKAERSLAAGLARKKLGISSPRKGKNLFQVWGRAGKLIQKALRSRTSVKLWLS